MRNIAHATCPDNPQHIFQLICYCVQFSFVDHDQSLEIVVRNRNSIASTTAAPSLCKKIEAPAFGVLSLLDHCCINILAP